MANKKMTKVQMFTQIMDTYPLTDEEKAFIAHEIELVEKKNASKSTKPTKTQLENEKLMEAIYNTMEDNRVYKIAELRKEVPGMEEASSPKFAALLNKMVNDGRVKKSTEKREVFWQKIA